MSDDRKGVSLRKKRDPRSRKDGSKVSAPKQISGPMPTGLGAATLSSSGRPSNESSRSGQSRRMEDQRPRERPPQSRERTAEMVKRRYSQKITTLPTDFMAGAPPMPSMPSMPSQYRDGPPSRDDRPARSPDTRGLRVDLKALRDPNLRPEQYVAQQLADASEEDIRRYQEDLRKVKNRTSTDLQHNVYQNRTQFIKISKEAEKLKGEMRTLRQLMSELTGTLGQTTSAGNSGDTLSARKQANRSSVANLEALWNTHLQTLWKRVEGSQKYLPAIPGRHIVRESGKWLELNAATYKAKRRVHFILLNDHLLVASEKKQRVDPGVQNVRQEKTLVAQRCWPLLDVQIADIKSGNRPGEREGSSRNTSTAINIRVGAESFTYAVQPQDASEKITMLSAFRKTAEDLRTTMEVETEERGKAQDSVSYFVARDINMLKNPELMEGLSQTAANSRGSMFVDIDGKQQSIRWVESQLDELDIDIALQRFDEAVKKVERLKALSKNFRSNAVAQGVVIFKLNERAGKLANVLIKQLVEHNNWQSTVKTNVDMVVRLGFEDRAREAYLESRTELIKKRVRQTVFKGSFPDYIFQVSFIHFRIIRNTVQIYQSCFPQVLMSACVKWAKEHVDAFNAILADQLSSMDKNGPLWQECMNEAHKEAAILGEVGLDFKELIGKEADDQIGEANGAVGLGVSS